MVGEAILRVNFVLNRVVTKNREATPYEGWNGRKTHCQLFEDNGLFGKG
jgi:hypothetical protein